MKVAIEYLEPMLARSDKEPKATLVVATVEGDIHDIGKNLVVLMLKNYGYHVIDLGKDVPADLIVDTAMKENAKGDRALRADDDDDDAHEGRGGACQRARMYGEGCHRRCGDHGKLCGGDRCGRLFQGCGGM